MFKVLIDPGHAPGCVNGGVSGYREYAGMWKLAAYLKATLERAGVQADLTRTENADPTLTARGRKAAGYDLFISEHSNAANGKARGAECFYSVDLPGDKALAAALSKAVAGTMATLDRGAKKRASTNTAGEDYYSVMDAAQDAGCKHVLLIENGFHDNAADEAFLLSDENLLKLAGTQADAICKALNVVVPPDVDRTGAANGETDEILSAMEAAGVIFEKSAWGTALSGKAAMPLEYVATLINRIIEIKGNITAGTLVKCMAEAEGNIPADKLRKVLSTLLF